MTRGLGLRHVTSGTMLNKKGENVRISINNEAIFIALLHEVSQRLASAILDFLYKSLCNSASKIDGCLNYVVIQCIGSLHHVHRDLDISHLQESELGWW